MEDPSASSASNRKWLWGIPVGCLLSLLICCGLPLLAIPVVFGAIKSSVPYRESLERVTTDAQVIAEIGEPVQPDWLVSGNISTTNEAGRAQLSYGVSGPRGQGTVNVEATRERGKWTILRLEFTPEDRATLDLLAPEVPAALPAPDDEPG